MKPEEGRRRITQFETDPGAHPDPCCFRSRSQDCPRNPSLSSLSLLSPCQSPTPGSSFVQTDLLLIN